MAHDLLQHLRRVARLDHQPRGGAPQLVNPEPVLRPARRRADTDTGRRQFDMRMTLPPGMVNTSWWRDKMVNVIRPATEVTNVEARPDERGGPW
jgi:hypothetical protein